ncbi:hypothetical protein R5H30_01550 [Sulfitobacter sp. D35]|uniref:hypothetical protein n=1 Tax=Sulfitobacter sp. D35 TaxID=3083252 RepID=UPI00296E4DDC|nr:hypothetical protein [Sulfitobacter sp. D35]MDW4496650.1 hypothetical protein [Sulfitobacter sp. D35]
MNRFSPETLGQRSERARTDDPALDYCLWPYARPRPSTGDALRTSALLSLSLAVAGVADDMGPLTEAIRATAGEFRTVFGVKWAGKSLSWEFYFYDYDRWERGLGMAEVARGISGLVHWDAPVDDTKPYFMFSIELDARHARGDLPLEQVDVYVGTPDTGTSAGICYGLTSAGYGLRNLYHFYDAKSQFDAALAKAYATVRLDARKTDPETLFWPEMTGAQTLVVANKRNCDAIYFSRIRAAQLALFLRRAEFPRAISDFLATNLDAFDHHLFDVGYDYEVRPGGGIRITKGSFYGLL